ncbi:MAG: AmpG family muropeptide MFS transporter [Deltaproteobacteria bacterium RBG_19FT_COMBO_60_16]|nr:MAG: AmpG family muropeptide MFS transporter [Deltaproteobacteria bacterium RBG_19FT_COMBO_60_16]
MKSLLAVFRSPRLFWVLLLGFSSGIPLALTGTTLQAWMATDKIDLTVIGVFSLVGLPYTVKYLWAPVMDRFIPPFLGRRRGWMLVTQLGLVFAISAMAFSNPSGATTLFAVLAFLVAFVSASQDVVVDAYRTEVLEPVELGPGAGVHILGYRIAMLTSGALALILADRLPWKTVYLLMAGSMLVGVSASVFSPEPQLEERPPASLKEAVAQPFVEFLSRPGALGILLFVILYKLDVVMATALTTPFMLELGFTKTDIGAVTKGFGMVATIVGTLAGGAVVARAGMKASLWLFGILQSVSTLAFLALARLGHHYPMMVAAIGLENLCSGMGTAAYVAFLMSLCNKRFTATQYALLTSLMAITRVIVGAPTGYLAKTIGWELYFLVSMLSAVPGLLLLLLYPRWTVPSPTTTGTALASPRS